MDKGLLRTLWFLYSDANTRINILIEESAHLQNTVYGLFSAEYPLTKYFSQIPTSECTGISEEAINRLREAGFERPVVLNLKSFDEYPGSRPRERALLGLWNSLGAVIVGLVSNQEVLAKRYEDAVASIRTSSLNSVAEKGRLFWFLATRGYYIDTTFSTYAEILEHAHEKIIQMQENRAGILPAPILLRRWNSGLQGDFLARYARHVNWEASVLVHRLRRNKGSDKDPRVSITHTWAHYSTSTAKAFSISGQSDKEGGKVRFGMIRSAYFYLEQPVLFPLLYHECAHLHFPSDEDTLSDRTDFFQNRRDAYQVLSKPGIGGGDYDNFWDHYTEEVWADSLAIALSGRSYLAALLLQLFSAVGRTYFSHEDLHSDQVFPFDTLAVTDKKIFEAAFPVESEHYFWEARIRVATRLCAELNPDNETQDFCRGVNVLLNAWYASGEAVFNAEHNSFEHAKLWSYRSEVNSWVYDTLWRYIEPTLSELRECRQVSTINIVSDVCVKAIYARTQAYLKTHFGSTMAMEPAYDERLENIALNVRLKVADAVASIQEKSWTATERKKWAKIFSNWCRHDGSTAFRLALEWYLTRITLVEEYVWRISSNQPESANDVSMPKVTGVISLDLVGSLKAKSIFNIGMEGERSKHGKKVDEYIKELGLYADQVICALCGVSLEEIKQGQGYSSHEVKVGTLSLGVLRTAEIVKEGCEESDDLGCRSPYMSAMRRVRRYFEESADAISALVNGEIQSFQRQRTDFHHMAAEYQFVTYVPGRTPTERDCYPRKLPSLLVKPRMVLQVIGDGIHPPSVNHIGKVTLVRFQHRAKWFRLYRKIKSNFSSLHPSMFVSSAWEDVVLVTWHSSDESLWSSINELGLAVLKEDVDTQSSVIVPLVADNDCESPINENQVVKLPELTDEIIQFAKGAGVCITEIRHRLGRSDLSVNWGGGADSVAAGSVKGLSCLPMRVWKRISGFSTVYEKKCSLEDTTFKNRRESGERSDHRAITIISMREM